MNEPAILFHIAEVDAWSIADTEYEPVSFKREGFIHLSTRQQVLLTASRYYADRHDMVLLAVAADRLPHRPVFENLLGGTELFPHFYGRLPVEAVVDSAPLLQQPDGGFTSLVL